MPASVTLASSSASPRSFFMPSRWTRPASVTPDERSLSAPNPVSGARWASPASVILQPRRSSSRSFLAFERCARPASPISGVEQRQVRELRQLADVGHAVVGNAGGALQVERLQFLDRAQLGQPGIGDSRVLQFELRQVAQAAAGRSTPASVMPVPRARAFADSAPPPASAGRRRSPADSPD